MLTLFLQGLDRIFVEMRVITAAAVAAFAHAAVPTVPSYNPSLQYYAAGVIAMPYPQINLTMPFSTVSLTSALRTSAAASEAGRFDLHVSRLAPHHTASQPRFPPARCHAVL